MKVFRVNESSGQELISKRHGTKVFFLNASTIQEVRRVVFFQLSRRG